MKPETVKYTAPLTYYGGKKRIAEWILQYIPSHDIYCEPFFGGGAVFFAKQPSYLEVINDHNTMLINFYRQCQENFDIMASKIQNELHSEFRYYQAEKIYSGQKSASDIEKAVATWLVFNQSWNASARAGWKFDQGSGGSHAGIVFAHARRNFCPWLKKRLQYVQISCRDALQVIRDRDSERTFFYLDPPYPDTNQGHYSGYTWEKLDHCLDLIQRAGLRPHLISVPFCHGGGALDPRSEGFPNLPPEHWKRVQRWDGTEQWGFSWHQPADSEGAQAIKTLYERYGVFDYFLDDDFRFAASPGVIGGCVCDQCRSDFLTKFGYRHDRWNDVIDDVRNSSETEYLHAWVQPA